MKINNAHRGGSDGGWEPGGEDRIGGGMAGRLPGESAELLVHEMGDKQTLNIR